MIQSFPDIPDCRHLNHSRKTRLQRFRSTARCKNFLGTISPRRAQVRPLGLTRIATFRPRRYLPDLRICPKVGLLNRLRRSRPAPSGDKGKFQESDGQTRPTLGPACSNDRTPPPGPHSFEKSMSALSAHNRRLIGTFHN